MQAIPGQMQATRKIPARWRNSYDFMGSSIEKLDRNLNLKFNNEAGKNQRLVASSYAASLAGKRFLKRSRLNRITRLLISGAGPDIW